MTQEEREQKLVEWMRERDQVEEKTTEALEAVWTMTKRLDDRLRALEDSFAWFQNTLKRLAGRE